MRRTAIWVYGIGALVVATCAYGDTVYLKNGAYIDGIIRSRNDQAIDLEIGKIGKIEIPLSDIDGVEKNSRTGDGHTAAADVKRALDVKLPVAGSDNKSTPPSAEAQKSPAASEQPDEDPDSGSESEAKEGDVDDHEKSGDALSPVEPEISPELKAKILQHIEDLKRQKAQYRTRAERHLRAIGSTAVYYLHPVTTHESELTRAAAMRLIAEFGDETCIETCLNRLLDPSEIVRETANRALERITQQSFGFQASATPRRREMAYAKWRKWWEAEKSELAATEQLKRAAGKGQ